MPKKPLPTAEPQARPEASIRTMPTSHSDALSFHCILPLQPIAKGRPRLGKMGAFTPTKTKQAEMELKYFISQQNPVRMDGPIKCSMGFGFERPKSVKPSKRPYMTVKPDLDNLVKLVADACNGLLWEDDCQIIDLRCYKFYSAAPQIILAAEVVRPSAE